MRDARHLQRDFHRAPVDVVGALERGRRRQLRDDDEIAAIELRDEADRRLAEFIEAEANDAGVDHKHYDYDTHRARRQPAIATRQCRKPSVEAAEETPDRFAPPMSALGLARRLEQERAQRR